MTQPLFLGLDLGTTSVKAVIVDASGAVVGAGEAAVPPPLSPHPGWSEQQPQSWWICTQAAVLQLAREHAAALRRVVAIGLSGQMHSPALLDREQRVLRTSPLWNDGRATHECAQLMAAVPDLAERCGSKAMPGLTAPKLLWLARHEPEVLRELDCVLLPKDFVRLQLTGERATDMSDAAGTALLDVFTCRWHVGAAAAAGISPRQLPRLLHGSAVAGHLLPDVAHALGLTASIPVAAGAGDNPAAAVGLNVVAHGSCFVTLGTSAAVVIATNRPVVAPHRALHAYCHALPGHWYQMGAMLSGASSLRWLSGLTGRSEPDLVAAALQHAPQRAAGAVMFLPYLAGARSPIDNPHARAMFFGMSATTTVEDLAHAVLEGVALGLLDALDVMMASGAPGPREIWLVGGGSRSPLWAQLISDVLGVTVKVPHDSSHAAAIGAARLAALAAGSAPARVLRDPQVQRVFTPAAERRSAALQRLARFRALYRATLPLLDAPHHAAPE